MNKVIKLSGKFLHKNNLSAGGASELPRGRSVSSEKINRLIDNLKGIKTFWEKQSIGIPPLVSITYIDVIAKSNRVSAVFSSRGKASNESIVGAKFSDDQKPKHIITHCISLECISYSIDSLEMCKKILDREFDGSISQNVLSLLTDKDGKLKSKELSKSTFASLIKDSYYIDSFSIPSLNERHEIQDSLIVSLFDTGLSIDDTLQILNFKDRVFERLDDHTWLLNPSQFAELYQKAPYLISMTKDNWNKMELISFSTKGSTDDSKPSIPKPTNEPVIGVIDTLFSKDVYFSEWVEYHELLDPELIEKSDYIHGTEVTSLIVDGPALNPHFEDDCGRFRVRHFGVAKHGKNSSFSIIKLIKRIVLANKDIKVWNLSLGSEMETSFNSVSPEAAILDQLQFENDIIFIISGTNNNDKKKDTPRVGAPADSINSIVVNSVLFNGNPPVYSRRGPVLCFFNKPDVCAYGGSKEDPITVFSPFGQKKDYGTSFAAPWITRKVAYLIYVLKFSREVAKALIVDAACGWNTDTKMQPLLGFGRVPTRIRDIVSTRDDEIKFTMQGVIESYETYAYTIPVPYHMDKFPYIAKATLCYYPKCSRNQGVDYTDTELDIHFGRINEKEKIKSIDNNMQGDSGHVVLYEGNARKEYRKWDNVKHISEGEKEITRPKKMYSKTIANETRMFNTWGLSIKSKNRLEKGTEKGLHFGVVITLKDIEGKNRIGEFIQRCNPYWFAEEVDIQTMVENYIAEEEDIVFNS